MTKCGQSLVHFNKDKSAINTEQPNNVVDVYVQQTSMYKTGIDCD